MPKRDRDSEGRRRSSSSRRWRSPSPSQSDAASDSSGSPRRSRGRHRCRSRRRRDTPSSSDASCSGSEDSGSDSGRRGRSGGRRRRDVTEEQIIEYMAKKAQKKAEKVAKKLKANAVSGYSNDSNPFGDTNLTEKFVWRKKIERDVSQGQKVDISVKYEKKKQQERMEHSDESGGKKLCQEPENLDLLSRLFGDKYADKGKFNAAGGTVLGAATSTPPPGYIRGAALPSELILGAATGAPVGISGLILGAAAGTPAGINYQSSAGAAGTLPFGFNLPSNPVAAALPLGSNPQSNPGAASDIPSGFNQQFSPSTDGTSTGPSKRAATGESETSNKKKGRPMAMDQYLADINGTIQGLANVFESINTRSVQKDSAYVDDMKQVLSMLQEDGVSEGSELFLKAHDIFESKKYRDQYKCIPNKEHRLNYIKKKVALKGDMLDALGLLQEDGVSETSELFFKACFLFKWKEYRQQFLFITGKEKRSNFIQRLYDSEINMAAASEALLEQSCVKRT